MFVGIESLPCCLGCYRLLLIFSVGISTGISARRRVCPAAGTSVIGCLFLRCMLSYSARCIQTWSGSCIGVSHFTRTCSVSAVLFSPVIRNKLLCSRILPALPCVSCDAPHWRPSKRWLGVMYDVSGSKTRLSHISNDLQYIAAV